MQAEKRAIPELSVDTQVLERLLMTIDVGGVISYHMMTAAIGRDVQADGRHIMDSARERVRRLNQAVFEPVTDVGLKRLDDIGIIGLGPMTRHRIERMARKGRAKLACVQDFDALPNAMKIEHNTSMAQLGAVQHFSSERTAKKLSTNLTTPQKDMPLRQCLKAMEGLV